MSIRNTDKCLFNPVEIPIDFLGPNKLTLDHKPLPTGLEIDLLSNPYTKEDIDNINDVLYLNKKISELKKKAITGDLINL